MNKVLILPAFLCLLLLCFSAVAAESEEKLLGDESDGSLSPPPHLIPLFPENEDGEKGEQIDPNARIVLPFSTRLTCGECHNYDLIKHGWHFNAIDSNTPAGRAGEPWIYYDPELYIQFPLSYRNWAGTYRPEQIGLSEYMFTLIFGGRGSLLGGGSGEVEATEFDDIGRQFVSGKLEINCLACHNGHYGQDMGGVSGYAVQVSRQNFRWAAAASSEFTSVTGSASLMTITYDPFRPDPDEEDAPTVTYHKEAFNENNEVLFDIVREVPNERCYFCHSELYQETDEKVEKWTQDVDIHLMAGLKCVDCHRNGIDHNIVRGYDGESDVSDNPLVDVTTCESCHISSSSHYDEALAGRFGAPIATHPGIPTVHFEKLTCTACHSGPWPKEQTILTKTSRSHRLGTPNVIKEAEVLPHVISPVFASQSIAEQSEEVPTENDKIGPYRALWPAFWGSLQEDGSIEPLVLDVVDEAIGGLFEIAVGIGWPQLNQEMITKALAALQTNIQGKAIYISGGTLYSLDDSEQLTEQLDHPSAQPYLWPIGHNVRPAAQALGVRYCTDCHSTDAPLFFGDMQVDGPIVTERASVKKMFDLQNTNPAYAWAFAASFVFRPWLKIIAIGCSLILAGVLLLYALKALSCVAKVLSSED